MAGAVVHVLQVLCGMRLGVWVRRCVGMWGLRDERGMWVERVGLEWCGVVGGIGVVGECDLYN